MSDSKELDEPVAKTSEDIPSENQLNEAGAKNSEEIPSENQLKEAEKNEETKLKAKYPQVLRPGGSVFLQKRLQNRQKYFDSGDYNMAKAKGQKVRAALSVLDELQTGEAIPTPEDLSTRKTCIVQSKLATEL